MSEMRMNENKEVLNVSNLRKVYGSKFSSVKYTALEDLSLRVCQGEFVAVMGPSGSGKTTLLNVISTIDKATSGKVLINNEEVGKLRDRQVTTFRRKNLGFIFQDCNLLDTMSLKENIVLPLTLANVSHKEIDFKVKDIASKLGILEILSKYPYEVSGGQKQRAAAARAIITNPSLILADEPTGALDSRSSRELLSSLQDLNVNNKATILMVTHDSFAASFCSRVIFIKDGKFFNEIYKGNVTRQGFYDNILRVLKVIGGGENESI